VKYLEKKQQDSLWTGCKKNTEITKPYITQCWIKYRTAERNLIRPINRMPRNRLPKIIKKTTIQKAEGRQLKSLLDV